MSERYAWDSWRHTAIHSHTYILSVHHAAQKMAVGYETSHLSQKKRNMTNVWSIVNDIS